MSPQGENTLSNIMALARRTKRRSVSRRKRSMKYYACAKRRSAEWGRKPQIRGRQAGRQAGSGTLRLRNYKQRNMGGRRKSQKIDSILFYSICDRDIDDGGML